jgi:amino acid transporter
MKRFNILIYLTITGLLGIYQFFPFFETYTFGLINSIYFFGLCVIYFSLLIYEIYLNNQEVKYEKKKFDKSSIWLTIILFLTLILFNNVDIFESETILKAEGNYNYTLNLKKDGRFKLRQWSGDHSSFYKGKYIMRNDTLKLLNNNELSTRFLIDTVYIKKNDSLIPESHTNKFIIIN